jgi:hypothetical protein
MRTTSNSANVRLGWKGLLGTNNLAYYEHSSITAVKSFIALAHGLNSYGSLRLTYSLFVSNNRDDNNGYKLERL